MIAHMRMGIPGTISIEDDELEKGYVTIEITDGYSNKMFVNIRKEHLGLFTGAINYYHTGSATNASQVSY